jgi:hypothetical protein
MSWAWGFSSEWLAVDEASLGAIRPLASHKKADSERISASEQLV